MSHAAPPSTTLAYSTLPVPTEKLRLWPAYLLTACLLLGQFLVGIAVAISVIVRIMIFDQPYTRQKFDAVINSPGFLVGIFSLTMVVNIFALAACLLFSKTPRLERIALRPAKTTFPAIILFCLATLAIAEFFTLAESLFPISSPSLESITSVITSSSHLQLLLAQCVIAFIGPVLEELLFRGYIQTRLVQHHGPLLGILITSALFGIFHMDLVQGAFAFTVGLFFGTVAYRTRSVIPSIFCHISVNATSTVLASCNVDVDPINPWVLIPAVVIFAFAVIVLSHTNPRRRPVLAAISPAP